VTVSLVGLVIGLVTGQLMKLNLVFTLTLSFIGCLSCAVYLTTVMGKAKVSLLLAEAKPLCLKMSLKAFENINAESTDEFDDTPSTEASDEQCSVLDSPTSSDSGEEAEALKVGDKVEAYYQKDDDWHNAVIHRIDGSTYEITWDDGDTEDRVKTREHIKKKTTRSDSERRAGELRGVAKVADVEALCCETLKGNGNIVVPTKAPRLSSTLQNAGQILACVIASLQGCPQIDAPEVDEDLTRNIQNGATGCCGREWMRLTKSRILVTRPRSIIGRRFSHVEESRFYKQHPAIDFALEGLRVKGWLVSGVVGIVGGAVVALLGVIIMSSVGQQLGIPAVVAGILGLVMGAWILCRDRKRLGTMRFPGHEFIFRMPRSDFDEVYNATLQLQAKLHVTITELKESIDDVEPDSVFERVSAAVHKLLPLLCDFMRSLRTKNVADVEDRRVDAV